MSRDKYADRIVREREASTPETAPCRQKSPEELDRTDAFNRVFTARYGAPEDKVSLCYLSALKVHVGHWLAAIDAALEARDQAPEGEGGLDSNPNVLASRVERLSQATNDRFRRLEDLVHCLREMLEKATGGRPSLADRIRRIEEQVTDESQLFTDCTDSLANHTKRMKKIEELVNSIDHELNQATGTHLLGAVLDAMRDRSDGLESALEDLATRVGALDTFRVNVLESRNQNLATATDKRLTCFDGQILALDQRIAALEFEEHAAGLRDHQVQLRSLVERVNSIESAPAPAVEITVLAGRLTNLVQDLKELRCYAHRVGGKITVATGDHSSLAARLEGIEATVRRLQVLEKEYKAGRLSGLEKKLDEWRAGVDRALDQIQEAHP